MGDLPSERVHPFRALFHAGVDFFGSFWITHLVRGGAPLKAYGCLFVCLLTKATHLEVVSNLSTEAFLACLKCFISRRELKNLFELQKTKDKINEYCSTESFKWKFIPPRSPHFGGMWESSVEMVKEKINKVIGTKPLTYEELEILSIQIESLVNLRPLTSTFRQSK
ncbi:uncharacterized protein LOC129610762 [Condylostylus longicornis]|uniref:uncharacterized protein LOC129610762 n=1 Tax=Condylostylus longicornis TaxID=2530218 RepID=UPI00244E1CD6|nr:uncharacterized protein LOC129610762 [Condylostylus longicornis]